MPDFETVVGPPQFHLREVPHNFTADLFPDDMGHFRIQCSGVLNTISPMDIVHEAASGDPYWVLERTINIGVEIETTTLQLKPAKGLLKEWSKPSFTRIGAVGPRVECRDGDTCGGNGGMFLRYDSGEWWGKDAVTGIDRTLDGKGLGTDRLVCDACAASAWFNSGMD